jgi:hypothetical protein
MPQIPPDRELKAIESALGELIPLSSRLDRDKLMFQAGAMSKPASRRRWGWPAIVTALSVALAGESLLLSNRPAARVVERVVFVPAPDPAIGKAASGSDSDSIAPAPASTERQFAARQAPLAPGRVSSSSWAVASEYQRLEELVTRFGLDALPGRSAVVFRDESDDESSGRRPRPAGAMRSLELERILKPGDPS